MSEEKNKERRELIKLYAGMFRAAYLASDDDNYRAPEFTIEAAIVFADLVLKTLDHE